MQADDPLAQGRRRSVLVTASVAVLVLLVVAGALTWVQVSQALGARAWREGDALTAAHRFAAGSRLNPVERWKAPFNRGVAAYSLKAWAEAAAWFETAMDRAPEGGRCRVALNWAWTLEALGDELEAGGDHDGAGGQWRSAQAVLAKATNCDEDPGAASSEREQAEQTQGRLDQKSAGAQAPHAPEDGDAAEQNQHQQLEERNRQGAANRQQREDQHDGGASPANQGRTW
jgi:tetratricopeptide (TPR) repeat protein